MDFRIALFCVPALGTPTTARVAAPPINFNDNDASVSDFVVRSLSPRQGFAWTNISIYTNPVASPSLATRTTLRIMRWTPQPEETTLMRIFRSATAVSRQNLRTHERRDGAEPLIPGRSAQPLRFSY
jgi:hypothetical protein